MSKRLIHVAFGLILTGCTINQYGPRISVGERNSPTVIEVAIDDDEKPNVKVQQPVQPPVAEVPAKPHRPQHIADRPVIKNKANCIPMPVIPETPKLDISELAKYSNDQKQLQALFERNHAELFKHSQHVKRMLNEWYAKANHC